MRMGLCVITGQAEGEVKLLLMGMPQHACVELSLRQPLC